MAAPVEIGAPQKREPGSRAMEDLIESLTRGNATEVKVVLATVIAALAVYS